MSIESADVTLAESLAGIALEDLQSRHRRERKDLQAKIQALKKTAPKNDKKKRKEAMEEVARMESDLEKKQAAEVDAMEKQQAQEAPNDQDQPYLNDTQCNDEAEYSSVSSHRVSKAQKRRDKKAREARQREEDIRTAEGDAKNSPKAVETRTIDEKLLERNLVLQNIPSDGDCLYNAVRHQMAHQGLGAYSVKDLRNEVANYIRAHKDTLICYMTNPKTGDLLSDTEFAQYCETLRTTPAWGGHIELKALSSILKVPIEVLQAEGPPTVQGANEFPGPNLLITYHRHMYSLGEHYNSTLPIEATEALAEGNENE